MNIHTPPASVEQPVNLFDAVAVRRRELAELVEETDGTDAKGRLAYLDGKSGNDNPYLESGGWSQQPEAAYEWHNSFCAEQKHQREGVVMRGEAALRALRQTRSLVIDAVADHRPEIKLATAPLYGSPAPVTIEISTEAFFVLRHLERDEIEAIRDWLTAALAAIDTPDDAPVAAERLVA